MRVADLATPAALVELPILRANIAAMAARAAALGCRLRPHVKTHKCPEIARLQMQAGAAGITVSTLAEARAMAGAGISDMVYAVPVAPQRVAEAVALHLGGLTLHLLVDGADAAAAVSAHAAAAGAAVPVWLKVDCGAGRAGVAPGDPGSVALARRIADLPGVAFAGVLTHAGQAYRCASREEVADAARQERDTAVGFAERLGAAGVPRAAVSIGSTPTVTAVNHLAGVDEIRPGNYAYFDATQVALGSCTWRECAFTVLATVIGVYPERRRFLLDAGALALSRDEGPRHIHPTCGFGVVLDSRTGAPTPGLRIVALTQEHAAVETVGATAGFPYAVGDRVHVVPNHSCLAAACFDVVHAVEGGRVVGRWPTARGW